ncbi:putative secondary metabolism biosynthetic enzyme [Onygenales sp. PD_12]|nr:putative secondary metabolism biosynthetic enzyme [Onygenales sp. PD_12]
MAIEAIFQKTEALVLLEEAAKIEQPQYRLRDVVFEKALVLNEGGGYTNINLSISTHPGVGEWHEFKISSLAESTWTEHCHGLVRAGEETQQVARTKNLQPLEHPVGGHVWHKAMADVGHNFGPRFQKLIQVESVPGKRYSRTLVSLEIPESKYPQSPYPIHPACIDGCLQSCAPSLWNGNHNSLNAVLVVAMIDSLTITSSPAVLGLSLTSSEYSGLGRPENTKNYISNGTVYDPKTGKLLLQLAGLRYHGIDTGPRVFDAHTFSALVWKPDVTLLSSHGLQSLVHTVQNSSDPSLQVVEEIITLATHKRPIQRVLELNTIPGESQSVWLSATESNKIGKSCRHYSFHLRDLDALVEAGEQYSSYKTNFTLLDIEGLSATEERFDFVIVRLSPSTLEAEQLALQILEIVEEEGQVLFLHQRFSSNYPDIFVNDELHDFEEGAYLDPFRSVGFTVAGHLTFDERSSFGRLCLASVHPLPDGSGRDIELFQFTEHSATSRKVVAALQTRGWLVRRYDAELHEGNHATRVLVLDELESSLLPTLSPERWKSLKGLLSTSKRILWVTKGSQMSINVPENAMIHGLGRTVRSEDPSISLTTLDVSGDSVNVTIDVIDAILHGLGTPNTAHSVESEFVERGGLIHVGRVQPDDKVNDTANDSIQALTPVIQSLHDSPAMIRLHCERVGTTDSLVFTEVSETDLPLKDNFVEVEIYAAGLNFKDVAITMGIVPDNEYALGLEGAGTVRRMGKNVQSLHVGQRVLVFKKASFCNRVHVEVECVHPIPDSISFEEASTLASGYLTALYSIHDLANTQPGHRVLIHSATGGLGLAAIQICQHIRAEVFATVGSEKKRKFLIDHFNIPPDHIFNSRDISFVSGLMSVTGGYGVDVILNSLTSDILDESWRCIAAGGTMVELGKKDMLDRRSLSMEPFGRNASYRCFDMSHDHVSPAMKKRLLKQLFKLLEGVQVKPIRPITIFPYEDIGGAMRYMRSANHIGKIVISSGSKPINVPVRPIRKQVRLRNDVAYLLIGGLKGLCGSLAVRLANLGARHLAMMARSGYTDEVSQRIIHDLRDMGCVLTLIQGDVCVEDDVRRAIKQIGKPVGGVIQGAMVIRDRIFTSMTIEEFHQAVSCKVQGTWNLHNVLLQENQDVDFFTLLSSVAGVVGTKGQANYAAANAFLDAFAAYRRSLGLTANSIDLGPIQDVGYISHHTDLLSAMDSHFYTPINEALMLKIVEVSLGQQLHPISPASSSQLITGIAVPQREGSSLLRDARFSGLCFGDGIKLGQGNGAQDKSLEIQALLLLVKNKANNSAVRQAVVDVAVRQFTAMLSLGEPMEPAKPLVSYGLDSLAAVEFRNWLRVELKVEVTALEITSASSLMALCEKIASRLTG